MANILYVGFYALPDKDAAANRVINNAKALREAGHTVFFLDEQNNCSSSILETEHDINGFVTWSMLRPTSFKGLLYKMTTIKNVVTVIEKIKNVDVVILYNYPSIAMINLYEYCKTHNIKVASDCTEWYSGKDYHFPMSILSAGDSFLRMRYVQKKLDGIIGISSFLCNYYKKCKNVVFIPPLVDKQDEIWHQEKIAYDMNKLNLVYTGNLGRSKEVFLPIVEAIENSTNRSNIVLRIVGATKEQFIELCPNAIKKLEVLGDSVVFLGRVAHIESLKILSSSDFIVFLRERNRVTMAGFSTKFVEALSCGVGVITTDTGDIKTYLKKFKYGYIIDENNPLSSLLDKDISELKHKKMQETDLFDFRLYIPIFDEWLLSVLS